MLVVNVPTELTPVTTFTQSDIGNFSSPSGGRLQWEGADPVLCHVSFSLSSKLNAGINQDMFFTLNKNGTVIPDSAYQAKFQDISAFQANAYHKIVPMVNGDYLSIFVTNLTDNMGLDVYNLNIIAMGDGT